MPRTLAPRNLADLTDDEPGLAGRGFRLLPARRSDIVMVLLAIAASGVVLVNALALQSGRPVKDDPAEAGVPLPLPAPAEARRAAPAAPPAAAAPAAAATPAPPLPVARPAPVQAAPAAPKSSAPPSAPPAAKPAAAAPGGIGGLSAEVTGSIRPPADVTPSPRVLSVQKALAKLGYGPIRIDGRSGAATREAIERFERDRRLPISGEVSDRLVRELNAVSGFSVE